MMPLVLFIVVPTILGTVIGGTKGREGLGFILGLLFSFPGVLLTALIVAFSEDKNLQGYTCPHCKHPIDPRVSLCGMCRRNVTPSK